MGEQYPSASREFERSMFTRASRERFSRSSFRRHSIGLKDSLEVVSSATVEILQYDFVTAAGQRNLSTVVFLLYAKISNINLHSFVT